MYTPNISLSPATVTAITAVVSSLVAFITGVLCGAVVTVCISRRKKIGHNSESMSNMQEQKQTVAVYDKVDTQYQEIVLKENVSYGPLKVD